MLASRSFQVSTQHLCGNELASLHLRCCKWIYHGVGDKSSQRISNRQVTESIFVRKSSAQRALARTRSSNDEDESCCSKLHGNLEGYLPGKTALCDDKSSQPSLYASQKRGCTHVIAKYDQRASLNSMAASEHLQHSTFFLHSISCCTLQTWISSQSALDYCYSVSRPYTCVTAIIAPYALWLSTITLRGAATKRVDSVSTLPPPLSWKVLIAQRKGFYCSRKQACEN